MAGRSANAAKKTVNAEGANLTPEQQAELKLRLEAAFKLFARKFRGRGPKDTVRFVCRVMEMSEEPFLHTDNFGTTAMRSMVKVELLEEGMEAIRFVTYLTDNPKNNTVQNHKAVLNHLVRAATGREIPEHGPFLWDTDEVVGATVVAVIRKGGERTDGQRGGLWSEIKDFETYFPDTDEEEEEVEVVNLPVIVPPKRGRAKAVATVAQELEDAEVPF